MTRREERIRFRSSCGLVELRRREGMPLAEAVIDAGVVRFRPRSEPSLLTAPTPAALMPSAVREDLDASRGGVP